MTTETIPTPEHISPAWLARPVHSPWRRYFSVLCYRGWCDHELKRHAIAAMVEELTGADSPLPDLPVRACPIPAECQCECHDKARLAHLAIALGTARMVLIGLMDLDEMSDAEWAAENYWHGHD